MRFKLDNEIQIKIEDIPIQWIPKIEIYYPDLPQFPIMYIHKMYNNKRIIGCPVCVNYDIHGNKCDAIFKVLINEKGNNELYQVIYNEISNRIGKSDCIDIETIINCCKGDDNYIKFFKELWQYIQSSYGDTIPYGQFFEEVYSMVRFVSAWTPKTGRQSEMRMLYNFMSAFGEPVEFPKEWSHLEYYIIPNYDDAILANYKEFPKFKTLYKAMSKIFNYTFTNSYRIENRDFKVLKKAWANDKDSFIKHQSDPMFKKKIISSDEKNAIEKLVDAFNRHPWRASFFVSSYMNINDNNYKNWDDNFFTKFYLNGGKLKGYSQKVLACILQQGFKMQNVIPIDTWIETFYMFPLGIDNKEDFFAKFNSLGKLERLIWLSSQSNKTNMRDFFNILWCQRYGTIGNKALRGINPIACAICKLKNVCVGHNKLSKEKIKFCKKEKELHSNKNKDIKYFCYLDDAIPKKVSMISGKKKISRNLVDEFSAYELTQKNKIPQSVLKKGEITLRDFTKIINI